MARWLLSLALLGLGCRTTAAAPPAPVEVEALEVSFDPDGRGHLELSLRVNGGRDATVTQAQWQLLLDGHPLGSGVQLLAQRVVAEHTLVTLTAPLPLPRTARDEGWRTVTLEVSGELIASRTLTERWQFAFRRQALVRGAPR